MIHDAAAQIAGIGVLAIVCQWLGWRQKLPAIVFLLSDGTLARLLGVAEPEPKVFLIAGANRLAREIAQQLNKVSYRTLLADSFWENIEQARNEGLDTYYGNPVSEHADRHLDLIGYGGLLGLSPHSSLGSLAVLRYRREFGDGTIYALHANRAEEPENLRIAAAQPGHELFGKDITYSDLNKRLENGAVVTIDFSEDEDFLTSLQEIRMPYQCSP